jgi:hypothetical protein
MGTSWFGIGGATCSSCSSEPSPGAAGATCRLRLGALERAPAARRPWAVDLERMLEHAKRGAGPPDGEQPLERVIGAARRRRPRPPAARRRRRADLGYPLLGLAKRSASCHKRTGCGKGQGDPSVDGSNPTDGPSQMGRTAAVVRGLDVATGRPRATLRRGRKVFNILAAWQLRRRWAVRRRRAAGIDPAWRMTLSMTT